MIESISPKTKPNFTVEAVVIRACTNCGKSPIKNDDGSSIIGPVPTECPHCGTKLAIPEDKGTIYDWQKRHPEKNWKQGLTNLYNTIFNK